MWQILLEFNQWNNILLWAKKGLVATWAHLTKSFVCVCVCVCVCSQLKSKYTQVYPPIHTILNTH